MQNPHFATFRVPWFMSILKMANGKFAGGDNVILGHHLSCGNNVPVSPLEINSLSYWTMQVMHPSLLKKSSHSTQYEKQFD